MSAPLDLMASDQNMDLIRRIIEARVAYERLCGAPPTCIHLAGTLRLALSERGFKAGALVAGMKIVARTGAVADEAICSRDEHLFDAVPTMPRGKSKR